MQGMTQTSRGLKSSRKFTGPADVHAELIPVSQIFLQFFPQPGGVYHNIRNPAAAQFFKVMDNQRSAAGLNQRFRDPVGNRTKSLAASGG